MGPMWFTLILQVELFGALNFFGGEFPTRFLTVCVLSFLLPLKVCFSGLSTGKLQFSGPGKYP